MSLLDDCASREITDFSGPNLIQDEEDVRTPRGLIAQDIEYLPGLVGTRRGFSPVWTSTSPIVSLYHWLQSQHNRLVYLSSPGSSAAVVSRDLNAGIETAILSNLSALGMSCAQAGYRLFMAFYNAESQTALPTSTTEARVWDGTFTNGQPNIEKPFPRALLPTECTFQAAETGPGLITKGVHSYGVIFESYGGGQSPISPAPANGIWDASNAPSFTASGRRDIRIILTPIGSWPTWVYRAHLVLCPVANPSQPIIVPGATAVIPRGSSIPVSLGTSMADESIESTGEDATDAGYFSLLTQTSTNTGPFSPFKLIPYSSRMMYLFDQASPDTLSTVTSIAASERFNYQRLTSDHIIIAQGGRKLCSGGVIGSVCYLMGPNWTFGYSDNTRDPVTWTTPREVSLTLGTPFIDGVCANSKGYLWVAHSSGLYKFDGGNYPDVPVSYYQTPDWQKINFSAPPNALRIIEHPDRRLVIVMAPVGPNQTTPNRLLVWDYTEGTTPDKILYCGMWKIQAGAYSPGSMEIVYSPTTKNNEVWMSPATPGKVLRQKYFPADASSDASSLYDDDGVGIDSIYRLGPLVKVSDDVEKYVAVKVRIRGNGTVYHRVLSLDGIEPIELPPISAELSPGRLYVRFFEKNNESCSYEVDNHATPGAFFKLTYIKTFFSKWMGLRPG